MAQRTVALCDGKYIGIESIYTVIHGRQINIPEKLKDLRGKSQRNELFCPCGCGTNLILVAGDKNLREQHFREKKGSGKYECKMPTEGKASVDAKIVLKCWLDDKLKATDLESRVPIDIIEATKRKPEFTFLSREKKFAVRYWRTRANIMEDRLDVLTGNLSGLQILYIVDEQNGGCDGQYPEALMKIQDRQGYCLLLSAKEAEYGQATLEAVCYGKDVDGFWRQIPITKGALAEYDLCGKEELSFSGRSLEQLYPEAMNRFAAFVEKERKSRLEEENKYREGLRLLREEEERRILDLQRQKEEFKERRLEAERQKRLEAEKHEEERRQREEAFRRNMEECFLQQKTPVRDAEGTRWVKCEFCGKIAKEIEFSSYGGIDHVNLGTCKECSGKNPAVQMRAKETDAGKRKYDPNICPECGGVLKEKNGRFGKFIGCSRYPKCRYTRKGP